MKHKILNESECYWKWRERDNNLIQKKFSKLNKMDSLQIARDIPWIIIDEPRTSWAQSLKMKDNPCGYER